MKNISLLQFTFFFYNPLFYLDSFFYQLFFLTFSISRFFIFFITAVIKDSFINTVLGFLLL